MEEVVVGETGGAEGVDGLEGEVFEILFVLAVLCRHVAVDLPELRAVDVVEEFEVLWRLFLEELLGELSEFAFNHVAFAVGHAVFGEVAEDFGEFVLPLGTGEGHEVVDGALDDEVVVDLDIEIEREVEVVSEGADDAVDEAVDGADGEVGIVVENGAANGLSHKLKCVAVDMQEAGEVGAHGGLVAKGGDGVEFF